MKNYLKKNWGRWAFNLLRNTCITGLSYYIIKLLTVVDFINEFKNEYEKYYLSSFVLLYGFMTYLFYDLLAKKLRKYFHKRRLRRKEENFLDEAEKELGSLAEFSLKIVLALGIASKKELKEMGEIERINVTDRELDSAWYKVSKFTSNGLCLFLNATITGILAWGVSAYYALPILIGIILFTLGLTYVIMFVINNIKAINKILGDLSAVANNLVIEDNTQKKG